MRTYTNKLLDLVDAEWIDAYEALMMCLKWMSESDVENMYKANDLGSIEDETE